MRSKEILPEDRRILLKSVLLESLSYPYRSETSNAIKALESAESELEEKEKENNELKEEILRLKATIGAKPKLYSNDDILMGLIESTVKQDFGCKEIQINPAGCEGKRDNSKFGL